MPYIDKHYGVIRVASDVVNGKTVTFPVDPDVLENSQCNVGKAVIPNTSIKSLAYYEPVTGKIERSEENESTVFKTLLNFIYWCDKKRFNFSESLFIDKVIDAEWRRHKSFTFKDESLFIREIKPISVETDPNKVFSKYSYRPENFIFTNVPYDCFSMLLEVKFTVFCQTIDLDPVC